MTDAVETISVIGGVVQRSWKIQAGAALKSHVHPYDHLSILLSGECMLLRGDEMVGLRGPSTVIIKAGIQHEIFAVTDIEWDCLHGLDVAKASGDEVLMKGIA